MRTLTLEEAKFSSPLGDFVFYICHSGDITNGGDMFSSPFGAFVFYIYGSQTIQAKPEIFSSPLGDFVFYILSLAVSINTELKTRFSAENIFEDIY